MFRVLGHDSKTYVQLMLVFNNSGILDYKQKKCLFLWYQRFSELQKSLFFVLTQLHAIALLHAACFLVNFRASRPK
jgi:hypothetical protein